MIDNPRSPRVRAVAKLAKRSARAETGLFLVEGPQAVEEALAFRGDMVVDVYLTRKAHDRHAGLVAAASEAGRTVVIVSDAVLDAMADSVTPQGVRIDLASPGSDALGRAGIAGSVDTFFWARFGSALLLSLVDDAAYIAGQSVSGGNNNFNNTTRTPSEGASIALQNSINIRPVLKKNHGEEVGIFVAKDFNFADVYNLELRR